MSMLYKNFTATIQGIVPTIMHNGRTANPLDIMTRTMKPLTSKRIKTDSEYELLYKMKWFAGLYTNTDDVSANLDKGNFIISGGQGSIHYPAQNIEGMMISAARKFKLGQLVQTGVICDEVFPLDFPDANKPLAYLWDSGKYVDYRKVRVGQASVIASRPIFHDWKLTVSLNYLPDIINESQVKDILITAGRLIGLSDFRPKYGRFEVL